MKSITVCKSLQNKSLNPMTQDLITATKNLIYNSVTHAYTPDWNHEILSLSQTLAWGETVSGNSNPILFLPN